MPTRKIVVRDLPYRWALTPSDDGLRIVVRGENRGGGKLFAWFSHAMLVTPYVVRHAIERGLDEGWLPGSATDATVHFDEPLADRSVAVPPALALDPREIALLDRISESDDTASRMVYADFLQDCGDPQGELIALSCGDRPLTPTEATRKQELEVLSRTWLGPVAQVAQRPVLRHGLLDSCVLGRAESGVVDAALHHRAWRTVRSIDARGGFLAVSDLVRLVTQPVLRDLRELTASMPLALELAFTPFTHPRLARFAALHGRGAPTGAMIAALCARMPALQMLVLPALAGARFAEIAAQSTAATLVFHHRDALRHARRLEPQHRATELVCCPWWESFEKPGLHVALRRGGDGGWSSLAFGGRPLAANYYIQPDYRTMLLAAIAALEPDSVIEIRCDRASPPYDDRRLVGALEAALAKTQPRARLEPGQSQLPPG